MICGPGIIAQRFGTDFWCNRLITIVTPLYRSGGEIIELCDQND
jgi:hypothetical protein